MNASLMTTSFIGIYEKFILVVTFAKLRMENENLWKT